MTLASVISLALLVTLGNWQWARKVEKEALLARLDAIAAAAPAELDALIPRIRAGEDLEYAPVRLPTPLPEPRISLSAFKADELRVSAAGDCSIMVQGGQAETGVLRRAPRPNPFLPPDDPENGVWRQVRPDAMLAAYGLTACLPGWYVAARTPDNPAADPTAQTGFVPPERHVGYALTWWGLALALLAVYVTLHVQQGRLRIGSTP